MRPVMLGYVQRRIGVPDVEVARRMRVLADFADREGYTLAEVFVDALNRPSAALAALVELAQATPVAAVAVAVAADLEQVDGSCDELRQRLERETGVPVLIATQPARPAPTDESPLDGSACWDGHVVSGTRSAHPARVYDYWIGGKDHFAVDRQVGEAVAAVTPWVATDARANRAFLGRAVRHLARLGVDQFLEIGAGLPAPRNVHEAAHEVNPRARVVYVDRYPVVLAHGRALLATDDRVVVVAGDARHPESILGDPAVRAHLDLGRPVAALFVAVLHFITDSEDPGRIVAGFRDAMVPGSYVVISHVTVDGDPERAAMVRQAADVYRNAAAPFTPRTQQQVRELFDGFTLLSPGPVPVQQWHSQRRGRAAAGSMLGGVGRLATPDRTA